jgi:hypothetical protein
MIIIIFMGFDEKTRISRQPPSPPHGLAIFIAGYKISFCFHCIIFAYILSIFSATFLRQDTFP